MFIDLEEELEKDPARKSIRHFCRVIIRTNRIIWVSIYSN